MGGAQPISGTTRLLPLIGHPVAQVGSPPVFNRYFAEEGIDAVIFPLDVAPEAVGAFLSDLRGWRNGLGCSVTVPHKQRALAGVDRLTDRARLAGSVNIVRREPDGTLFGDMTDGLAMAAALEAGGCALKGRNALVAGAGGGAGAAIVHALAEAGVSRLTLLETDPRRLDRLLEGLAGFPKIAIDTAPGGADDADLVVNATPLGMRPDDPLPVDPAGFSPEAVVAEVVTKPAETPLLVRARARGMRTVTGLDMVRWQLPFQIRHLGLGEVNPERMRA